MNNKHIEKQVKQEDSTKSRNMGEKRKSGQN